MKYSVICNLSLSTVTQSNSFAKEIQDKIAGKFTWGAINLAKGIGENNKPTVSLDIRFNDKNNMVTLFELIKSKMTAIPARGIISMHECSHDEGRPRPCVIEKEFLN